jgi:hypothetical protein
VGEALRQPLAEHWRLPTASRLKMPRSGPEMPARSFAKGPSTCLRERSSGRSAATPRCPPLRLVSFEAPLPRGKGRNRMMPVDGGLAGGVGKASRRGRREDALGATSHERVAAQSCPHCANREVVGWGRSHGLSRFRCESCARTFNALTKTPMARLRKKDRWLRLTPPPSRAPRSARGSSARARPL